MHEVTNPTKKLVWELDRETLNKAWLAYQDTDTKVNFGEWFLSYYYIPGIIAWPSLFNETDNEKAFDMLSCFTKLQEDDT